LAGLGLLLLGGAGAQGSGPLGVIAVIDKVVAEPSGEAPERVRVWGTFVMARDERDRTYSLPAYGFLYYALDPAKKAECRREWAEMQKAAGKRVVIGWADSSQRRRLGRVRPFGAAADEPDRYPIGYGLTELWKGEPVSDETPFSYVRSLMTTPAPVSPVGDDAVAPGKVRLVARNVRDPDRAKAAYWFVIESASGEKDVSDPIHAGEAETAWTPRLQVKAGEKYTWRVQAVEGDWKGPANTAFFTGKVAP
jgi:hypothetical protein